MRKNKRWMAVLMAVCLTIPNCGGLTVQAETPDYAQETPAVLTSEGEVVPAAIEATAKAGYSSESIGWTQVADASGYKIFRSENADGPFAEVGNVTGAAVVRFTDATVVKGKVYYYKVHAYNAADETIGQSTAVSDAAIGMEALKAHAALSGEFADEEQVFDGTRVEDFSDRATAVHKVSTGSIILKFKAASDMTGDNIILGTKDKSIALSSTLASGFDCTSMFLRGNTNFRFSYKHTQAEKKPFVFSDGNWHCIVLSSNPSGKYIRLTIDGVEQFSNTTASNMGMFAKQTVLDQVTIGGHKKPDGTIANGFKGSISQVIVTDEILTDAEAIEISRAGYTGVIPSGVSISEMFDTSVGDNSWVFTGGASVQGGFDQIRGVRNYVGQFEEYVRWTKSATLKGRQRYMINTAKSGQTLAGIVADYYNKVAKYQPKAAVYMVSKEDYSQGDAGIEAFKTNLKVFIDNSLALKASDKGFAVIQKPFSTRNATVNATIEKYCIAVNEVLAQYKNDTAKYDRIVVVDHFSLTNTDTFKNNCLQNEDTLNAKGHLEISKQLALATIKTVDAFPVNDTMVSRTEEAQPSEYLKVQPAVTSLDSGMNVVIPDGNGTNWKYELDMEGTLVEGNAASNTFVITGLTGGMEYTLKIQSADGAKQLTTMKGTITAGNIAVVNTQELNAAQQSVADMVKGSKPMNWLFMGDSITHAALWTYGYDGTAQTFEKYLRNELGRTDDVVINTAVSSADTKTTLENIDQRLEKFTPDVVSIMLGTNDAATAGLGLEVYAANMKIIIEKIRTINPDSIILFRSPAPLWTTNRVSLIPPYVEKMREVAEQTTGSIFIDQFTEVQTLINTYPWLKNTDNTYNNLFGNDLHPGVNGQLIMTRQFIKGCGLWTEDCTITNLFYEMNITKENSQIIPELDCTVGQIGVSTAALQTSSGLQIGKVTLKATDQTNNQSYSVSSDAGELYATLSNLPVNRTYEVIVSAYLKDVNKNVTFAAQNVQVTDQVNAEFNILLDNNKVVELVSGTKVGSFSVDQLAPAGEYTYSLCSGEGDADNGKFAISGRELKVAGALTEGQTYSVRVKAVSGNVDKEAVFQINAAGRALIFEKNDQNIVSGTPVNLSGEAYADKLLNMEEGTVVVQYTSTSNFVVQSLFSVSNGRAGNTNSYLSVYIKPDGALGLEIRNTNGFSYNIVKANAVKTSYKGVAAKNTIAIKADKANNKYKIFANGIMVLETDAANLGGFKFIKEITGVDNSLIGATKRDGAAAYPFAGTIHDIKVYGSALSDSELVETTKVTETPELQMIFDKEDSIGCNYFRIPSLLKLKSGTVISAIDARFGGTHDSPNNIDIAVSRSTDGGNTWSDPTMPMHYDDYSDDTLEIPVGTQTRVTDSASFIDPVLLQDEVTGRVFLIADAMTAGKGSPQAVTGSGYKDINGKRYLKLQKAGETAYNYTVRENNVIWNDTANAATEYSLNSNFEILKNGVVQTVKQKTSRFDPTNGSGTLVSETTNTDVAMNIMYADAAFKALPTTWLYMKYSDNDGQTWSDPILLNGMVKPEDSRVLVTGPGRGIQLKNGEHAGRLIIPVYDSGKSGAIYSDDHGATWTYAAGPSTANAAMSETQFVELPDGTIRVYGRSNSSKVSTAVSMDGGETFTAAEYVAGLTQPGWGSQLSVINYDGLIDGKPAIILSNPNGSGSYRKDGRVRIGLITDTGSTGAAKYSVEWKYNYEIDSPSVQFGYSCLTELPDNSIGILYEKYDSYNPSELHTQDAIKYEKLSLTDLMGRDAVQVTPKTNGNGVVSKRNTVASGSEVTINAVADTGYEFLNWVDAGGNVVSEAADYTFTITENKEFTAVFSKIVTNTAVTGVSLDLNEKTMTAVGEKLQLTAAVMPKDATNKGVVWTSTNPAAATVSSTGLVTAVADGTAVIKAVTEDGSKAAECTITVITRQYTPTESFIQRLYSKVFDRAADDDGMKYYTEALASGKSTGADVGHGFLCSEEFTSKALSNADYVEILYYTFMDRPSDEEGKAYWINFLENGVSREFVFKGFIESPEFTKICDSYGIQRGNVELPKYIDKNPNLTMFTNRLYREALGRAGEEEGLEYYAREISLGKVLPLQAAKNFIFSQEFEDRKLGNEEYVKVLYKTFMGREYDAKGLQYHLDRMEDGASREDILLGFAASPEFKTIMESFGL